MVCGLLSPSLLSFKSNPLKSTIKTSHSEGQQALNTPSQDIRNPPVQNDGLSMIVPMGSDDSSEELVNPIKEVDEISQKLKETSECIGSECSMNALKIDKEKPQLHARQ